MVIDKPFRAASPARKKKLEEYGVARGVSEEVYPQFLAGMTYRDFLHRSG